ncbi:MAG: DUF4437 domain-containing protein [Gammaproteobacteria bacterium]|nr:DUF4437 domain-containing protein [Gammaproteobacteria bacterium]
MFIKKTISIAAALTICACATVSASKTSESARTSEGELQWLDSGFGPTVSPVFGDFSKSTHVTFVRFTSGMTTPLHTHTADYTGVVLTGVTKHWEPGKPETEKTLPAGSHWFIPGGVPHVSECLPGAECVMALYQQGAMDFKPVE